MADEVNRIIEINQEYVEKHIDDVLEQQNEINQNAFIHRNQMNQLRNLQSNVINTDMGHYATMEDVDALSVDSGK